MICLYSCPEGTFLYTIQPYDTLWLLAQRYNTTVYAIMALNPGVDFNCLQAGQVIYICPRYEYCISQSALNLNNDIRMLWEQHVTWTRMTVISIVQELPDVKPVTNRLLRNPKDSEIVLKPFYGDKIASEFSDLLTKHLVLAAQLVTAAKAGDTTGAENAEKMWYENADKIAAFLGSINPYWSEEIWRSMLYEHLALTKSEAVEMLNKNYEKSIAIYDAVEKQALMMADVMIKGIIKQLELYKNNVEF